MSPLPVRTDHLGGVAGLPENGPGAFGERAVDLDGGDAVGADPVAEQRGILPGAGADLKYPVARLGGE